MYILFYSRYIFIDYLHPKQLNSRYSFITRTSSYLSSTVHRDRTQLKGVRKSKVPEITVMSDDGCSPFTSMVKIFLVLKSHRQERGEGLFMFDRYPDNLGWNYLQNGKRERANKWKRE